MKKKNRKIDMMKCEDLRVFKDNARPVIFEDKRKKDKHKKNWKYEDE